MNYCSGVFNTFSNKKKLSEIQLTFIIKYKLETKLITHKTSCLHRKIGRIQRVKIIFLVSLKKDGLLTQNIIKPYNFILKTIKTLQINFNYICEKRGPAYCNETSF